ncbi:MAG: WD40 repeat domain-containing protein, partial [Candidatus Peribacteraceae bacterium]|nr:WD40 repeat domain-containing protein [Candidatus Peribacteraceae bacterium]
VGIEGIYVWDAKSGTLRYRLDGSDGARPLAFAPGENEHLLAVQNDELVRWDRNDVRFDFSSTKKRPGIRSASYCSDGSMVALQRGPIGGESVEIITSYDEKTLATIPNTGLAVWCQQDILAVAIGDEVQLWDANTGTMLRAFPHQSAKIVALAFSQETHTLVSNTSKGDLYTIDTRQELLEYEKNGATPYANIGVVCWGSLRVWSHAPLMIGAHTNDKVMVWRFYGGKLEEVPVSNVVETEHQYFKYLSPKCGFVTKYRYQENLGHTFCLERVSF